MAWLVLGIFYYYHLNGDTRSCNFSCQDPFFKLPPYAEREKKPSENNNFLPLPTAGIKPGPPVQQASALSITSLPLGHTEYPLSEITSKCIGQRKHDVVDIRLKDVAFDARNNSTDL